MTVLFIRANRISAVAKNKLTSPFVIVLVLVLVLVLDPRSFSITSMSTSTSRKPKTCWLAQILECGLACPPL
jgi:hypothetical protein